MLRRMRTHRKRGRSDELSPRTSGTPAPLILIADDNRDERQLYGGYFAAQGFRVELARDGEVAFTRAVESRPDVIVMDLAMPLVDGWERRAG